MAYATIADIQDRMTRTLSTAETGVATALLSDAAVMIDATNTTVEDSVKLVVSCRMVIRAIGDGDAGIPVGASQGSMSGLGYSQSWTLGNNGAVGELYLTKSDRKLLGVANLIGSYSPTQELVVTSDD